MSVVATRSTTGCLACKTKRKKCDETKPHCLRCQKSNIECPGYTYIHPNKPTRKLRTLLAPRTIVGRSRTRARQGTPLVNPDDADVQVQRPIDHDSPCSDAPNSRPNAAVADTRTLSESIDMSNPWVFLSSFTGSLEHPSIDFNTSHGLPLNTADPDLIVTYSTSDPTPLSSGQASLLEALFSLGQPPDPSPQHLRPDIDLSPNLRAPPASNWSLPSAKAQDDVETSDDEDPEGVVGVICRAPTLDKTAEGNLLPFVLQSYATWIRRMAFEPLKMAQIARDFVFSHFAGGEESRRILTLLANIGSKIGSVEIANGKYDPMLSMLQNAVRRRLDTVKTHPTANRLELIKALDSALETIIIDFFVSPISEVVTLRQEAAPIFRQLCPEPPDASINLQSLLLYPPLCLRHYAHIDILFSIVMDMPTLFRYGTTISSGQTSYPYEPAIGIQARDSGLQWLHGIPDPLILLFAKMKPIRDDGLRPSAEVICLFEREILELQPFSSSSPESFLVIMRFVVQECWRQVAYVYLYMALCGEPSDAPRVKAAFKHFMKLLNGTKPGRLPDEFLIMNLILIAPAAQHKRDREVIRRRILGINTHSRTYRTNDIICMIEDYWARADAEGRKTLWSDVAISRKRVMGV